MGQEDGEQESFVLNEQAWLILDIVADIRVWSDSVLGQLTCKLKQQEDQPYSCADCIGIIQCLMLVDDSYR